MPTPPDLPPDRFVPLATLGDAPSAHLRVARLTAEGIECRIHGESMGPYPMTVGRWAETEIWVMESRLEEAEAILLEADVADAIGTVETGHPPNPAGGVRLAAAGLAFVLAIVVVRALLWLF